MIVCMNTPNRINLPDDVKHAFANGIFEGVRTIKDVINDYNLPTNNGGPLYRWNFMHRRIEDCLDGRFQVSYAPRGAWKVMLLFDQESGFTFSIMSEATFSTMQKRLPRPIHYLEALVSKNPKEILHGQLRLDVAEITRDSTALTQLRDSLLSSFAGIAKNHMLILFDYNSIEVTSVKAILPTPQLGIGFCEDWSKFCKEPYDINNISAAKNVTADNEEVLIRLKPQKQKENAESLVALPAKRDIVN